MGLSIRVLAALVTCSTEMARGNSIFGTLPEQHADRRLV